jgi:Phage integrase family
VWLRRRSEGIQDQFVTTNLDTLATALYVKTDDLLKGITERAEGPILLTPDRRRLDRHGAGRLVRRIARRAGIAKPIGPHTLRHAFITAALDAGVPLRDVQEAASHADPRTTMRYDRARTSLDRHATYIVAATSPEPPGRPLQPDRDSSAPGGEAAGADEPKDAAKSPTVVPSRPRTALLKDRVGAVVLAVAFRGPMGWLSNRLPAGDGLAY